MPNLVGIIDPQASSLAADITRMMDVVDIPEYDFLRKTAFARGVGFGNVLTGIEDNLSQPVKEPGRGAWLMLDGEILDVEGLRKGLRRRGAGGADELDALDDAELAMKAYLTFGSTFVERLNGNWNLVLHDPLADVTVVASDRIGSRILFYAQDGDRWVWGSEVKAVVAGRKVRSRAGGFGLLELLMGPYHHGDRTWVDGVHVFDPGTVLTLGSGRPKKTRYWRFSFNEHGPQMSEDDYAEAFGGHLRHAVARCTKRNPAHKLAITLSGGLDSRAIALSIPKSERPLPALTYGDADSADATYARQLAEVIGLDFNYVEDEKSNLFAASREVLKDILGPSNSRPRGFYGSQIDRIVYRDEVMGDPMGAASMIWHPLYSQHMNLMLQGACGDALTGSHLTLGQMKSPTRPQLIEDMRTSQYSMPREILELVFNRAYLDRFWGERNERFAQTFDFIDADQAAAIANVWDMENRQRRGAFSTFTMERYFCVVRAPFLDYELSEFLASVPAEWRFQQRVYKRMIVSQYPEAAHVPWAYTRGRITKSPTYEFAREVARFARRKVESIFNPADKDAHYAFRDTGALLRDDPEMADSLRRWLVSDRFDPDVFSADGLNALMDRHFGGDTDASVWLAYGYVSALARAHTYILDPQRTPPEVCNPARYGVAGPAPRHIDD